MTLMASIPFVLGLFWPSLPIIAQAQAETELTVPPILELAQLPSKPSAAQSFVYGSGQQAFTLWDEAVRGAETEFRTVRLQFEDNPEVWALSRELGSGGSEVLRTDTGRVLLRQSMNGGATFYPDAHSSGVPVARRDSRARSFAEQTLAIPAEDTVQSRGAVAYRGTPLRQKTAVKTEQSALSSAAIRPALKAPSSVQIVTQKWTARDQVFANAFIGRVNMAVARLPDNRAGVSRIRVVKTARPEVSFSGQEITLGVTPEWGAAGQPSSERLDQILDSFSAVKAKSAKP